jgi:hypothetical protein
LETGDGFREETHEIVVRAREGFLVFDFGGSVFNGFLPKVKSILEEIDEFLLRVSVVAG